MVVATLMQLWNDWELRVLVLVSFMFQVFLLFSSGLRRRSTSAALRFMIWLAYLLADVIAVYALGELSRKETDASGVEESRELVFYWTPFLLIHLGGQDTATAFSVEDNELWLRHLLNLMVQVGLALYVFWKSEARDKFLASAVFVFIAGIVKYGERTLALKSASKKALMSSTNVGVGPFPDLANGYMDMVRFALSSSSGVRDLFAGRKLEQMEPRILDAFVFREGLQGASTSACSAGGLYSGALDNGEYLFKILEIELGMMYDNLYTKARLIRTRVGAILRFVTLISLLAAFVLFFTETRRWHHSGLDVTITYTLFVGALCLDICAIFFMVMLSPWTWVFFRSWNCHRLEHAAWYIFKSLRPETRPWWSNSIGQYNFLNSCFSDSVIGKMMNLVGAKELWRNLWHTKRTDVTTEIKKLIFEDKCLKELFSARPKPPATFKKLYKYLYLILGKPFEEVIISLHIFTDMVLHRCMYPIGTEPTYHLSTDGNTIVFPRKFTGAAVCENIEDREYLMRTCRILSEYMFYLLVVHPDMLPVTSSIPDVLEKASGTVTKINGKYAAGILQLMSTVTMTHTGGGSARFLQLMSTDYNLVRDFDHEILKNKSDPVALAGFVFLATESVQLRPLEVLPILVRVWLGVLIYVAGKSRGEMHAKQLSMGGELLTFLWLHLAHRSYGDMGTIEVELVREPTEDWGRRMQFIWAELSHLLMTENELPEINVGGAEGGANSEVVSVEPATQGEDEYVYGYFYPAEGGDGQE